MSTPRDWVEEAHRRVQDAWMLLERGRTERAISAVYYAVHAAGKGGLRSRNVEIETHKALYVQLSLHFVTEGALPDQTASFTQDLYEERLAADYRLKTLSPEQATTSLNEAGLLIERVEVLL